MPDNTNSDRGSQITEIYQELLGRDPEGNNYGGYGDTSWSINRIRGDILKSDEYKNRQQAAGESSSSSTGQDPAPQPSPTDTQGSVVPTQVDSPAPTVPQTSTTDAPLTAIPTGTTDAPLTQPPTGTNQNGEVISQGAGTGDDPVPSHGTTAQDDAQYGDWSSKVGRDLTDKDKDIYNLYKDLLGRDPDLTGFNSYLDTGWSAQQIKNDILNSPEYKNKVATQQPISDTLNNSAYTNIQETINGNLNNPYIPESARQGYVNIALNNSEFIDPENPNYIADPTAQAVAVSAAAAVQDAVRNIGGHGYTAAGTQIASVTAAQGTVSVLSQMTPAQGTVTHLAEAAQGSTPPEALVSNQLETLLAGIENGDIPSWAQPAVDQVEAQLSSRGLSRSSVGQASLTNAIIQSAIPLASQNATTEANTFMANLNNRQQAALTNAQNYANMDLANLNNRQQARAQNAQAFLQMDLANLSNRQQANVVNAQLQQQAYLSDQSADNASRQFNASSAQQADQFMTQLNATIEQQNAARQTAVSQFNAGQSNSINQFNAQISAQREQFNTSMAVQIEQSNVGWRRQVNQINTAGTNAVNQANAMNAFNLSNQALSFLWQEYRDAAKWTNDAGQNQLNRETQLAMAALSSEASSDSDKASALSSLGAAAFNFFGGRNS